MHGIVRRRGKIAEFVIVETDQCGCALIELFGDELEVGEVVEGPFDEEGPITLRRADGTHLDCMIQAGGISGASAVAKLERLGG